MTSPPPDDDAILPAPPALRRRQVLAAGGALLAQLALPLAGCSRSSPVPGTVAGPTTPAAFLAPAEMRALEAFVERMIPSDADPGAHAAGAAQAIDHLLAAFTAQPPFIHAGAPFSDRGGHAQNHFRDFVPLDEYEALGWRIVIEGSLGLPQREFNGPVKGLQAIYREGLARLDALAVEQGHADFAAMPAPQQDQILSGSDEAVQELVDVGFLDTLDAMYGAPEYGGNQDLLGWGFTNYDGDVQPRGYSDAQIVDADSPHPLDVLLPASYHDPERRPPQDGGAKRATATTSTAPASGPAAAPPEAMLALVQAAEGRLSRLRALVAAQTRVVAPAPADG